LKNKKIVLLLTAAVMFILVLILSSCSTRDQARWKGDVNLGDLPTDMLYVEGVPQIITISTESSGDVMMGYRSTDGKIVVQLYGCAIVSINCGKLYPQGRYVWDIPTH
jgi:hypothetical protein